MTQCKFLKSVPPLAVWICLNVAMGVAFTSAPVAATAATSAMAPDCETLAASAARAADIPEGLLPAIARAESGGGPRRSAWPWTLNVQGQGAYFETREAALARLREVLASGVRNVDVGCMQINFRWHGHEFATIEDMMDPVANTRYAARFMGELHGRFGDWMVAARHYHSADPERGAAYLARVQRLASLEDLASGQGGQVARAFAAGPSPSQSNLNDRPRDRRFDGGRALIEGAAQSADWAYLIPSHAQGGATPSSARIADMRAVENGPRVARGNSHQARLQRLQRSFGGIAE